MNPGGFDERKYLLLLGARLSASALGRALFLCPGELVLVNAVHESLCSRPRSRRHLWALGVFWKMGERWMRREIPNALGPSGRKVGYLLLLGPSHRFGVGVGPSFFLPEQLSLRAFLSL